MKRLGLVALALVMMLATAARADDAAQAASLFDDGTKALAEGRNSDAIADFEAMGDRGDVDAVASFDRGLAYAERVRAGHPQPGDLGRAVHGFEEARELTNDDALTRESSKALALLRAEIARRRARADEPVDMDAGVPLGRAIVELASESAWAWSAALVSLLFAASLMVRRFGTEKRARLGAAIALAVFAPSLVALGVLTLASRDERLHLREAIVVADSARLSSDAHVATSGVAPLPEGARVTLEAFSAGWTKVRFRSSAGWVPSPSLRELLRK